MNILRRMSRTLTEVGPTLRMTLFRDEQRRRLTTGTGGPESRLAARGGSGAYKVVIKGTDCRCIDGKY